MATLVYHHHEPPRAPPAGRLMLKRMIRSSGMERLPYIHAAPATASSKSSAAPESIATRLRSRAVFTGFIAITEELASVIQFNCVARSLALCQRWSGCLARHFRMVRSSSGGVSGFNTVTASGSLSHIALATLNWLLPSNARLPVTISYRTAPQAKMSERASASLPSICSGDMYWMVPTTLPAVVSGLAGLSPLMVRAADKSGADPAPGDRKSV